MLTNAQKMPAMGGLDILNRVVTEDIPRYVIFEQKSKGERQPKRLSGKTSNQVEERVSEKCLGLEYAWHQRSNKETSVAKRKKVVEVR